MSDNFPWTLVSCPPMFGNFLETLARCCERLYTFRLHLDSVANACTFSPTLGDFSETLARCRERLYTFRLHLVPVANACTLLPTLGDFPATIAHRREHLYIFADTWRLSCDTCSLP